MDVLLHDDVAAAGELGVLVADQRPPPPRRRPPGSRSRRRTRAGRARRTSGSRAPRRRPARCPASRLINRSASSKHRSSRWARMWNSRSPGVAIAVCLAPTNPGNGCSEPGAARRTAGPTARADADDARQLALGQPEADRPLQPADVRQQFANAVLGTGFTVSTRKIAASVSGVRTACGSAGSTAHVFCTAAERLVF